VSAAAFTPSGVITLTTDFGHKGPFVATMKGVMLSRLPSARIVDLTHETSVHFPAEAGFWLRRSYRYFPAGTVHVAVVDPGVGTQRDIIAAVADGHAFLAPDNGLLAPIAQLPGAHVFKLELARLPRFGVELSKISATFHGRDIFAPVGAELAAGRVRPDALGSPAEGIVPSWVDEPQIVEGQIRGVVIAVDNFGNLITNIDERLLAGMKRPVARAGGHTFALRRTYGDVRPGDYLGLINSFGVVEIARAEQSAADGLGLERGAPVVIADEADPG
jgi:S-adenosyl-L-methionine hydrolase (adenosine-forming)